MTTKGNKLQLLPSTLVQRSDFFFLYLKKRKKHTYTLDARVLSVLTAGVKKSVRGWRCTGRKGKGDSAMTALSHTHLGPLLIPACFSGASSPARPATPLVPCSSTTPPPPPPRPPSRPKLPPGKPGVGDVVRSLLPWLAQRLMVRMTNRSQNAATQATSMASYEWPWQVASERQSLQHGYTFQPSLPQSLPSFKSRSKMIRLGGWGSQFCYSASDANE